MKSWENLRVFTTLLDEALVRSAYFGESRASVPRVKETWLRACSGVLQGLEEHYARRHS